MTEQPELKTIGLTPAIYCADQALFHVTRVTFPSGMRWRWLLIFCFWPRR
jgi:hypothetical protein